MSEWYFNPVGTYALVTALAIVLFLALALFGLPRAKLTPRKRAVLIGLRLAVLLLMLMALLRPALVETETKKQSATLVLLIDQSRSMLIGDSFGGATRWATLKTMLQESIPTLKELGEDLEIKIYTFDEAVHGLDFSNGEIELAEKPAGEQTAIGAALEDILRREAGKRLAGVVLLSDGAQRAYAPRDTPAQSPARRLADLGYPLYTLSFGQGRGLGEARDVSLRDLVVNQTVYVKNELAVQGMARLDGFANQRIPVQLLFEKGNGKMDVVAAEELRAGKEGQSLPIAMSHVPQTPGEYKVTLRAAQQPGELVTTNNELSTFVTVLKGGLNVLYLEGELRQEQTFLRRSLDASPDVKVDYVYVAERDAQKRAADLLPRFERGKYDVYILGDLDSEAFKPEELKALAQTVKEGAGLIMLGGLHTFGPGGYFNTPLADVLPVTMDPLDRQRYGEPTRKDVHLPGPLKIQPAKPLGVRHFVMSLGATGDNAAAWNKLPPLDGANKLGKPKANAHILAESASGDPLLLSIEAGGRTMAFAGDSTWRWWMKGHSREHKRFWRQVVLWLAHKDEQTEGNVWVNLTQRRFSPNSRVEFTVGAQTPEGDPVTDATFEVEVLLPDKSRQPAQLSRQADDMVGTFAETQTAGDYTVVVTASKDGQPLGTARSRFLVFERDLELDNAAADPTLLASLAEMTAEAGGQSLAPEELPALLQRIKEQPMELEVETQVKHTPWNTWPFYLAFVGLLSTEWYFRKKWGLV